VQQHAIGFPAEAACRSQTELAGKSCEALFGSHHVDGAVAMQDCEQQTPGRRRHALRRNMGFTDFQMSVGENVGKGDDVPVVCSRPAADAYVVDSQVDGMTESGQCGSVAGHGIEFRC